MQNRTKKLHQVAKAFLKGMSISKMHCIWMLENINYKLSAVQKYFYRAHMQDFS